MSGTGVFDLDSLRDRKNRERAGGESHDSQDTSVELRREPLTVIVQVSNVREDAEVHRHIGINDALTFSQLHNVLVICFDLPAEESPWHFYHLDKNADKAAQKTESRRIDPSHHVAEFLWREDEVVEFTWGLWDFSITVADIYPRDKGTPQALCVGGSGSFPGSKFDLTAINAELTGQAVIDEVLTYLTPPARSIVERSRLFDFVPLLQALDLSRNVELSTDVRKKLASLPREVTTEGQDAFWSIVLGLACMGSEELMGAVTATTMEALGWISDDGEELTAEEIWEMCGASTSVLASVGACGPNAAAPVDRLDIFRALLRGVG
ncbi:IS1096 element passenger TnpR family protein [Corynebacterium ammoniagenes]|uniref:Plasmid pRiA4b Orf3-like domain-containing protein n=2 Tax=Corynebacterium ammoniagenes TaxID=1697 RepID=A0AAV5G3I8_CORAM|nr:hypothetical protein [Corynebacterium ammoniagenes]APT81587.1 hypothetical protein CAMM_01075 [Corynebacterium ammoniagenes DSM 20306]AQS72710.1 hypothetical protein CA40472_01430 [Corynebacterium ammoniagenes]EFG80119.1 hypothetical protein HMPREF0281_02675 [Corynebacterium ammoniagenes DSM 20306]GJN43634.1 hypothetical protein CAT723_21130 [Corynebacterium ammoniagenes]